MSLSPNSSLVRRTIELNYANKQRSASIKWIFINGTLFLLLTYDLWCKCPGYTSVLHYVEACCCGLLGAALLALGAALLPRRSPPQRLTRAQQRLLGLRDEDLDSSFRIVEEPTLAPAERADAAEPPASLSPPRSWRGTGRTRAAPPSPPPAERAVRDEFIADRSALHEYLDRRDRVESARGAGPGAGAWPAYAAAATPPHQLAPLHASAGGATPDEAAGAAAGATVWRRLHVDPQHLTQFNLNLRRWLHATVLERLVRELDACDAELATAGHEARPGTAAAARLAALAAVAAPPLRERLRALLPFLRPFPDQKYLVARIRELARGGCLSAYRWDGGGAGWDPARPTDAELVLHLFAAYMDGVVPGGGGGGAFSAAHVSVGPTPPRGPQALVLHRAERAPPHYVLVLGEDVVEVCRGRNNLLHSLLLFVAAVARREPPALHRLHLGPAGLNMLWILGR